MTTANSLGLSSRSIFSIPSHLVKTRCNPGAGTSTCRFLRKTSEGDYACLKKFSQTIQTPEVAKGDNCNPDFVSKRLQRFGKRSRGNRVRIKRRGLSVDGTLGYFVIDSSAGDLRLGFNVHESGLEVDGEYTIPEPSLVAYERGNSIQLQLRDDRNTFLRIYKS